MNEVAPYISALKLDTMTLEELQRKASSYGRFSVADTGSDGPEEWFCRIKFGTMKGIQLEAKSGFYHKSPHDAIVEAICKAQIIQEQFK